jgi:RimJ/RimL family protein N-acetyltransferase
MIDIRKLTKEDLYFLNSVRNDCAELYLHDSRIFSVEDTYSWFEKTKPDYYLILYNNISIGYFRLSNHSLVNKNIYIGADLHKDWMGKGLAYESYCKFIPFIFETYNLNKITLEVLSSNSVAINLYKKLGFVQEGIKRKEIYKNGVYIDSEIMSMLRDEYEKKFNK